MQYRLRNLKPDDIPGIMDLQNVYQRAYPGSVIIPGEVYLSPLMDNGNNVICAFDDDGVLSGYTAVSVNIAQEPEVPHIIWSVVKADPILTSTRQLQNILFDAAIERARDIIRPYPGHEIKLKFQHHVGEADIIDFLESQGCTYEESIYRLAYDLSHEPVQVPLPDNIYIRDLDTEHEPELREYLTSRNEHFPERVMTLKQWRDFYSTSINGNGKVIVAYNGQQLAGGILVYQNPNLSQSLHMTIGITEEVFVCKPWRNRGIAACMMYTGLRYFKDCNLNYASLEVRAGNETALRLYKKQAYQLVEESRFYALLLKE